MISFFLFSYRINDHSPVVPQFIHQIKKRSTCPSYPQGITEYFRQNQCLRTLAQYKKYDCKRFLNGQAQK